MALHSRRSFLVQAPLTAAAIAGASADVSAPAPYGAIPSRRQIAWSQMEFYNFLHFTVNTFTDKEWGYGDEDPAIFNPTSFDADAIAARLKEAGSKGVILTCKHHDGFCLWPTKTTDHCIRNSPYKAGHGDIVKELSAAAARHGLKFGVYLSPWDRNNPAYGTPQYIQLYRQQMRELLTGYGPIFEIWHDGANGGDGYYGGARENRVIDKLRYYGWAGTWQIEHDLQPMAAIFSDVGPDARWVGNEKGIAGDTCWATYTPMSPRGGPGSPGDIVEQEATSGTRGGKYWMPAECDVSIRPGWFWHESENGKVKTARELLQLYYDSAGRGAGFLLNVPPDRRGLIHESDAASLREFGGLLKSTFARNLASGARIIPSNVRGRNPLYGALHLIDGNAQTYWATDDSVKTPEVVFELPEAGSFNLARLRENIQLGQRVSAFAIDVWRAGQWAPFGEGASIGICRIVGAPGAVTTTRVRLRITASPVCPALSEFSLFSDA